MKEVGNILNILPGYFQGREYFGDLGVYLRMIFLYVFLAYLRPLSIVKITQSKDKTVSE
jgi:hypothetical protein